MTHVYAADSQPMTRFTDPEVPGASWSFHPRHQIPTDCCGKRRWAKYVRVKVYYDCINRSCAEGRGCRVKRRAR